MPDDHRTARYQITPAPFGNRYRFFCEISGEMLCMTEPFSAATPEEERMLAWEKEGKAHFNRCRKCGKWVSNAMFNADLLQCVDCAPWQEEPKYCPYCGKKLKDGQNFCDQCGKSITRGDENR